MASYTISSGLTSMYGQPFAPGGNDQFAGHKDDPESGLHYNLARSYSPIMSRWPSPDPVTSNVCEPKCLNKYAYVRNDPINLVDPDGRDPDDPGTWIFDGPSNWMIWATAGEYVTTTTVFAFGYSEKGMKTKVLHPPLNPFDRKINGAKNQARHKLEHASKDCLDLLMTIGVTVGTLNALMDRVGYTNGLISDDNYWAARGGPVGDGSSPDTTVGDVFRMGAPPWPSQLKVNALSSYANQTIYFRQSAISWDNLIHELAHQASGEPFLGDQQIMGRLAALYGSDPSKEALM